MREKGKQGAEAANPGGSNGLEGFEARVLARAIDLMENPEKYQEAMAPVGGNPITLGPRVADPTTWVEDQVKAAKGKAEKWLANSLKPKKVPSEAALAAKGKYKNKMQESLDGDFWPNAMGQVDETIRMEVIKNKGAKGFSDGIDAHKPKAVAKVKKLQPLVLALAQELDAMDQDTDEQREAKMIAAKRGMQKIGKVLKGVTS